MIDKMLKTKGKTWLWLSVCGMLFLCCAGCAQKKSGAVSGYADAKNGVVVVCEYVTLNGMEEGVAYGSGFFVGEEGKDPQYLVTNHHVIADYLYFGAGQQSSFTDDDGNSYVLKSSVRVYFDSRNYVEAYVVGYNEAADVAVLRLAEPTDQRCALTLCSPTEEMVGSSVYAIGYPGIADNPVVDPVTTWGLSDITYTSGIISRLTTTSGSGVQNIQIDVSIGHGNSGGPIVNGQGEVVGISASGLTNNQDEKAVYAVNIDEVLTLLKLHSVPYAMASESKAGGSQVLLLIVAGAAVLLILIIVFVALAKKKDTSAGSGSAGQPVSPPPAAPVSPAVRSDVSAMSAEDSGYRLQGVSGALEGRRIMIRKDAPLTIGRNAEVCNVSYPAATAGVSGKHCQVWYDHGSVWIKDLGSSHGTFLSAGVRLSAGQAVQIKPGEQISLGSQTETLVLAEKG